MSVFSRIDEEHCLNRYFPWQFKIMVPLLRALGQTGAPSMWGWNMNSFPPRAVQLDKLQWKVYPVPLVQLLTCSLGPCLGEHLPAHFLHPGVLVSHCCFLLDDTEGMCDWLCNHLQWDPCLLLWGLVAKQAQVGSPRHL